MNIIPWTIASLLGLSVVSDWIGRRARNYESNECFALPRFVGWGLYGNRRYFVVKLPGAYWRRGISSDEWGWHRECLCWIERTLDAPNGGWSTQYVLCA